MVEDQSDKRKFKIKGRILSPIIPIKSKKKDQLEKMKKGTKLFDFSFQRSTYTRSTRKKDSVFTFLLGECLIDRNQVVINDPKGIVVCDRCLRYYHRKCWAKAIQRRSLQGCPNCFAPISSIKTVKL